MRKSLERKIMARLRVRRSKDRNSVDGFLFRDAGHACKWLKQPVVRSSVNYRMEIVQARMMENGDERVERIVRKLSVEEYLTEFGDQQ